MLVFFIFFFSLGRKVEASLCSGSVPQVMCDPSKWEYIGIWVFENLERGWLQKWMWIDVAVILVVKWTVKVWMSSKDMQFWI